MNIPDHAQRIHWLASFRYLTAAVFGTLGFSGTIGKGGSDTIFGITMVSIVWIAAIGFGAIRWWRFRYWLEDGRIRGQTGGLIKTEIDIPFEKIQAVNLTSPIVYRVFGLKRVSVKTAAAGTQFELTAVSAKVAEQFKRQIENNVSDSTEDDDVRPHTEPSKTRKLSTPEIMIAAATSRQFLVSLGVVGWISSEFGEIIQWNLFESLFDMFDPEKGFSWETFDWTIILAALGVVVAAWVVTVIYTVLQFRAFSVARTDDPNAKILITRGLGEIQEIGIAAHRVQAIEFIQTPLQVLLGYSSVQIRVIGHAEEKGQNTVLYPSLAKSDWGSFLDEFVTGFRVDTDGVHAPARALPRFLLRGARLQLTTIILIAIGVVFWSPWGGLGVVVLGSPLLFIGLVIGYIDYRVESVAYGENHLTFVIQNWTRTTAVVRRDAYQLYEVKQNILQSRMNLATFGVMVASGPLGVTHVVRDLDADDATQFVDSFS